MICIIDYDLGNVISIKNAVNKIGYECIISNNPSKITTGDFIFFKLSAFI